MMREVIEERHNRRGLYDDPCRRPVAVPLPRSPNGSGNREPRGGAILAPWMAHPHKQIFSTSALTHHQGAEE